MEKFLNKRRFIFGLLIGSLCYPAVAQRPKFSDQQIVAMTPQYFKRMRPETPHGKAPEFLGGNIYRHPQRGKVFQVDVRADRNQENEGLAFAFSAMLHLSRYFKKPPKLFVAIIHSTSRGTPPIICTGGAECTADHYLNQRISYEEWYHKCIAFEKSWPFTIVPGKTHS